MIYQQTQNSASNPIIASYSQAQNTAFQITNQTSSSIDQQIYINQQNDNPETMVVIGNFSDHSSAKKSCN